MQVITLLLLLLVCQVSGAQDVCEDLSFRFNDDAYMESLSDQFGYKKVLPEGYEKQALLAMSYYPELKNITVNFIVKKTRTPLMSMPSFWSTLFKAKHKRKYLIIISQETTSMLEPILLKNLPLNAQIGVIGHELAHTSYFVDQNFFQMIGILLGNLSSKYLDQFEFNTDQMTIAHGLGWQLLAWSEHVTKSFRMTSWVGADQYSNNAQESFPATDNERYMRPGTIRKILNQHYLYNRNEKDQATQFDHKN